MEKRPKKRYSKYLGMHASARVPTYMELLNLLKKYKKLSIIVVVLGLGTNILALSVPRLTAGIIDIATKDSGLLGLNAQVLQNIYILAGVALMTFVIAWLQIYFSSVFAETVAYNLRKDVVNKIGNQAFSYIAKETPSKLLTLITSDVDAVKGVISNGLVTLLGAAVTLFGAIAFLISINVRLGLYTVAVIPLLVLSFALIFGKLSKLFQEGQENLEKINAIINESIVGASLVRVLSAANEEIKKFAKTNTRTREIGLGIVRSISALIPAVIFLANLTTIIIVWFGGKSVIEGSFTIGGFSAFLSYTALFIWPLFVLAFVGPMIGRGLVSIKRIDAVLKSEIPEDTGTYEGEIKGDIEFDHVTLTYTDENGAPRTVLKDITFEIKAGTKTAIIGPTAAGKTQIFYLLAGMVPPTEGKVSIDNRALSDFKNSSFLSRIGLVFQDSIMFNSTFRENIALSKDRASESGQSDATNATESNLQKAIQTADLTELVASLPRGLDTHVSERGTSLSGGQKQRIMLARALAINPQILLLDDFTARVDRATEASILKNVSENYPDVTLISITQKIEPIQNYDHIIVIMEGELVAAGKHEDLLRDSFEYKQIYESQQSTEADSPKESKRDSESDVTDGAVHITETK